MKTKNQMAAFLEELGLNGKPTPEPDEYSAQQLADEIGMSVNAMQNRLLDKFRNGQVTRRKIGHTLYYRIKK